MSKLKAVFLDRDGTLIIEKNYIKNPADVALEKEAAEGAEMLHKAGYALVIVTNQSGIARGFLSESDYQAVQDRVVSLLKTPVLTSYHCPHLENCDCRKPQPGMLLKAIESFNIDPKTSFMMGDKESDIEAGRAAGVRTVLVRTGYGKSHEPNTKADFVADSILDAARRIVK